MGNLRIVPRSDEVRALILPRREAFPRRYDGHAPIGVRIQEGYHTIPFLDIFPGQYSPTRWTTENLGARKLRTKPAGRVEFKFFGES